MKSRNKISSLTAIIMLFIFAVAPNIAMARTVLPSGSEKYFGITELRTNDTPNMGYAIKNPASNGSTPETSPASKIWNIQEYTGEGSSASLKAGGSKNIYCVKAGVGFSDTKKRAPYNVNFDMKTESDEIESQNDVLASIVDGTVPYRTETVSKYDALLALGDMLYLIDGSTSIETFLESAGIKYDDYYEGYVSTRTGEGPWDVTLTQDDIVAVQQAAIWYFTNYGETTNFGPKYDLTESTSWLNYTLNGTTYNSLSGYNPTGVAANDSVGSQRQAQAEILYKYLIDTAKANANNSATEPVTVSTTQEWEESANGQRYIVGPIRLTDDGTGIVYTIGNLTVKVNGTATTDYKILDSSKTETNRTLKQLMGQDFYISVTKEGTNKVEVNGNITYSTSNLTLWASTTNNAEQPLMIPEKVPANIPISLTVQPNNASFDLALRKYITKVGTTTLTGTNSRVPVVDESTLASGTTASYKHTKQPVTVSEGNKVTYAIRIYNEGEKAGRATKIVDQLPAGLKFTQVVSGNFELDSYSESNNTLNLKRKATNTNNLPAYTSGSLQTNGNGFETIEIECEVTATPNDTKSTILTNIAYISEAYDAEADTTYSGNVIGHDRDSAPGNKPSKNKNELVTLLDDYGYTGGKTETVLNKTGYHYIGEQDDDDFEKLVILPQSFDLALIKRITAVNNNPVPERIKSVDTSKLNRLDNNGEIVTTADYELDKNPVAVKTGDIVTYTFRIYNEGTIDGYASEITEDIPDGLEFIFVADGEDASDAEKAASDFNMTNGWTYTDSTMKTISTTNLALHPLINGTPDTLAHTDNLITAFGSNDGTKTFTTANYKEISVKMKVTSEDETITIRNEAYISEDEDVNGNPIEDRDSDPTDPKPHPNHEDDEDHDFIELKSFDLALRKFIIAVSKNENITTESDITSNEWLKKTDGSYTRAPKVDTSKLNTKDSESGEFIKTAIYNHPKTPVEVSKGDLVIYNLRVYNEGNSDGYAAEIKDHLPSNLEFVAGDFNEQYGWTEVEGSNGRVYKTDYLKNTKIDAAKLKGAIGAVDRYELTFKDVPIMCKVKDSTPTDEKVTNIADITKYIDEDGTTVLNEDRDSQPDNVDATEGNKPDYKDDETGEYIEGQQDDDDFEKIIIPKNVDLALTKFITAVSKDDNIENGEYLTPNKNIGSKTNEYTRATVADTTGLKAGTSTNATYTERKDIEPLVVGKNSYVLYNIRVYNEGEVDVYAGEVTDYLPENLDFVDGEFNKQYGWTAEGQIVKTNYLSSENGEDKLLKAFDKENDDGAGSGLYYKDLPILCKVSSNAESGKKLINTAEITKYEDEDGNELPKDIDSTPENKDEKNVEERDEDDDDYEVVLVQNVDLALTKFIIAISEDEKIEDGEYLTDNKNEGSETNPYIRQTAVDTKELRDNAECHDATYIQVKDPLLVNRNAYVLYNIRVYNEGNVDVYAGEVTDYLPENLDFVDGEFNKQYGWTAEGQVVKTTLLSSENGEDKILKAFDKANDNGEGSGLDYKDLPILCQVNSKTPTNRELVNTAEITKYEDEDGEEIPNDVDSTPENKEEKNVKNREEDDDDYEVVVVKEFDLALRKWVTQAIVTEDGKTTVTNTGHQPYDDPEAAVKVELNRKKLSTTTVKFRYGIRVINEGDIAGYAKEITDYVPEGLTFVASDNPEWTDKGNNVITTRQLENVLLEPGQYKDISVLLTWVKNENNMGLKTNTAEISEDYNEYGVPDKDSTPNNKTPREDDIDDAPVLLSIKTGQIRIYFTLGLVVLITIAGGVSLIKKYVL